MIVKYKITELAKDLNVDAKDIISLLAKYSGEAKKTGSSLNEEELNIVFEHYTTLYAVKTLDAYFAEGSKREQKKAEKKKEEKPFDKKRETKPAEKAERKAEQKAQQPKKEQSKPNQKAEEKAVEPKSEQKNNKREETKTKKPKEKFENVIRTRSTETLEVQKQVRKVNTRNDYVELDKYNEKYIKYCSEQFLQLGQNAEKTKTRSKVPAERQTRFLKERNRGRQAAQNSASAAEKGSAQGYDSR